MSHGNQKSYPMNSPTGEDVTIINMNVFCKEHGLNAGNMTAVFNGVVGRRSHKGWTRRKEKTDLFKLVMNA